MRLMRLLEKQPSAVGSSGVWAWPAASSWVPSSPCGLRPDCASGRPHDGWGNALSRRHGDQMPEKALHLKVASPAAPRLSAAAGLVRRQGVGNVVAQGPGLPLACPPLGLPVHPTMNEAERALAGPLCCELPETPAAARCARKREAGPGLAAQCRLQPSEPGASS